MSSLTLSFFSDSGFVDAKAIFCGGAQLPPQIATGKPSVICAGRGSQAELSESGSFVFWAPMRLVTTNSWMFNFMGLGLGA